MKKLFTLVALLTMFMGAKAEEKVDAQVDFSTYSEFSEVKLGGWGGSDSAKERLSIQDGCLHFESTEATDPSWDCQFYPIGGPAAEVGVVYTLHYKIKGSQEGGLSMSGFGCSGRIPVTTSWVEGTLEFTAQEYTDWQGTLQQPDCNILVQCGEWIGSWDIAYLKITHEETASRPVEWIELLENGDASKDWSDVVPAGADTPDNDPENFKICAWGKEYAGRDASNDNAEIAHPHPATIVEEDGDRVFVVKTNTVDPNEFPDFFLNDDGTVKGDPQWQNQFWIESPHKWYGGEQVHISFKYKASKNTGAVNTQCHAATPGSYLHWAAIGDITFTTEWQEFDQVVTLPTAGAGMYSVAFNLGANDNWKEDIDFYFDDLSWQEMKLDHGYFVAASNSVTGINYDFDNAIEFVDGEDGTIVATVGTVGKEDSWVNEVMISTVRGNNSAFKSGTIKPAGTIVAGEDEWIPYVSGSNAKIKLPAAGVWQITIAPEDAIPSINFVQLEGEAPQELVDIKANPTEIVVEGVERDWKAEGEEGVGEGLPWDNQFWILANRALETGEETYIEFEYKSSVPAKTTTQCHGDIANGGNYMHWAAIGDVNFETEWQTFSTTFTVPEAANGMQSIAFNMAEIKEACNYEIKNVIWCVGSKEESYESLIDMEAANKNFWAKVGAGTNPYNWAEGPTGINSVVNSNTGSAAIYNLAGQRVSNTYKGIVVKEGKKYLVK